MCIFLNVFNYLIKKTNVQIHKNVMQYLAATYTGIVRRLRHVFL